MLKVVSYFRFLILFLFIFTLFDLKSVILDVNKNKNLIFRIWWYDVLVLCVCF